MNEMSLTECNRGTIRRSALSLYRWIIVCDDDHSLAWSGSRWVPIVGQVQVCNFKVSGEAVEHAYHAGIKASVAGEV